MILPVSPEVAVVFCNESRCGVAPSAEIMQRAKIPHLDVSLLKDAPHQGSQLSALVWLEKVVLPSREPVIRTKENAFTCFQAFAALVSLMQSESESMEQDAEVCLMHPSLKSAFEAAYPPKSPTHRDLVAVDFEGFFGLGLGEDHFTRLLTLVEERCRELATPDTMEQNWALFDKTPSQLPHTQPGSEGSNRGKKQSSSPRGKDPSKSLAFQSAWEASQALDSLRWMFEERQDILATFVQELEGPMGNLQAKVFGTRARRE
ncbi:hypothetical protein PG985_012769 [Apiospora marii]|uniref:uncharacterized protein n=1 Tax=Apiospora marii TaxID=335849 RepID=UPI0031301C85